MSYSFSVRASTKAEAKEKVRDELAKVCEEQPIHTIDRDEAFHATVSLLKLLPADSSRDVAVTVSGSIWNTEYGVNQVSVNVSVGMAAKNG